MGPRSGWSGKACGECDFVSWDLGQGREGGFLKTSQSTVHKLGNESYIPETGRRLCVNGEQEYRVKYANLVLVKDQLVWDLLLEGRLNIKSWLVSSRGMTCLLCGFKRLFCFCGKTLSGASERRPLRRLSPPQRLTHSVHSLRGRTRPSPSLTGDYGKSE